MRNDKQNLIVALTFQFSLLIIEFSEVLEEQKNYVLSRQVLRSGTSIGANVRGTEC
jgi:four helix bundle protein